MISNNEKSGSILPTRPEPPKDIDGGNIRQYIEQFHADFDPVYSMLMNYQCAVMEVETKLNILNNRLSIQGEHNPIESIKSRVKSLDSIILKLEKNHWPITIESVEENLHDVAGVRVVCSFADDIYRIEEALLAQEDVTLVNRKDYISNPKPSGYRSLHLIIQTPIYTENGKKDMFVEVQMRTIAMDFWASLEHKLRYKKDINPQTAEQLAIELKACAEESAKLDDKMLQIRNRISADAEAAALQ
ncbi:MAG: GTP pyrophosphokinase family protein [Clostridia bacterium]|nr:GTP pyrophosphokinase family protein [Clostridia bacterium]